VTSKTRRTAAALATLAVTASLATAVAAPAQRPRDVFALYMVCFFQNVEFYKQEIELAQRHGIDGFLLDFGAYNGNYVVGIERLFQAAKELGTGFAFIMTPEYSVGTGVYDDFVKKFYEHPNWYRLDGKPTVAIYSGNQAGHHAKVTELREQGFPLSYLGFYTTSRYMMSWSVETAVRLFDGYPLMDGLWHFSCDGQTGDLIRLNANGRRATQMLGKRYMAGACFMYNSANLRDHRGMHGYLSQWEAARRDGADLLSIITWNDYNEDSNLMPYRWQRGWGKQYYDRDEAVLDFTGYASAVYKTGRTPEVTQDKLYITYRNRSRNLTKAWDPDKEEWVDILTKEYPFDQLHDDAQDCVYVTAMTTAPTTLVATLGQEQRLALPAGLSHHELPHVPGVPRFRLERDGTVLANVVGRKQIIAKETKENSLYGKHLSNRTWTSAVAVGPVTRIEAESGTVHEPARVIDVADVSAVRTSQDDGSGFTVPVKGLTTATYNVRFRYSNAGDEDARLTLMADGPPRGEGQYPYFIPVHFPPTGEGTFATVSFFWSLYDATSYLKLAWLPSVNPEARDSGHRSDDDHGAVIVDAVELVKVDPVRVSPAAETAAPELVAIPGGSFRFGRADTVPDEAPVSDVRVSPFAVGRYEVTNAEFEQFMPEHREFRDGYSWRDTEPVICIRWTEAVAYCNWLSEQNGLAPAYAQAEIPILNAKGEPVKDGKGNVHTRKEWVVDLQAEGFRLPTEAEWEYVASGRGESRPYPWGDATPVPQTHGNFMSEVEASSVSPRLRSRTAEGVMSVGSYPAGASRDGVMDLAGNVAEWCTDWFTSHSADAKRDPVCQTPSNYRSIRGSSWGYYGFPQRVSDREYNNPNYPGYIYLGFRVAISDRGFRKLR